MLVKHLRPGAVRSAALACCSAAIWYGAPVAAQGVATLPEVNVTGDAPGGAEVVAPAHTLSGDNLLLQRAATLGDTLQQQPGVASSYFGPNAGRPILRGLDGDRVHILQNGGASVDASALSYDHNVPVDSLAVERVDLLTGPAALLYGGSAQGGVVNVIDNRIPREPLAGPEGGVTGRADTSWASGAREAGGAALLEGGTDRYALHVDAFARDAGDTAVPAALACSKPGAAALAARICNSASRSSGGALGGTVFFSRGYLGASFASYRSDYGSVAEDDVSIGMRSTRGVLEGLWRNPGGLVESVRGQFSHNDYQHTEYEGGQAGTLFTNRGDELRLEARHRPWGKLTGLWGAQWDDTRFAALGDEAFVPFSRTRTTALFAHEQLAADWGRLSLGVRTAQVRVSTPGSDEGVGFAPDARRFTPASVALGAQVNLKFGWQLTANLSRNQRAPRDYELFANGPHVATGAWEVGNSALALERSTSAEVGARWQGGPHRFAVTAYASHYGNYLALLPTGATRGADDLPEYAYSGVKARFVGAEASATVRLRGQQGIWQGADGTSVLDLDLRADTVRATNLTLNQPLPLIAPARLGATLRWADGPWGVRLGFDHALAQRRVPAGERVTAGYTLWNAALTWRQKAGGAELEWYARVDNVGNQLAYSATSILTQTAFGRVPLPGRSVRMGVQAVF
ncbi:MAG: TonB-dependent receptor [Burkholderiaceae bacterium]|nr:TonB-dependent receptor [Burkholderiaceae bacterium]